MLEGSELTGDNENPGSESGECNLKYVLSETTHKEIPEVLARVTPLDEAVEHCGVSCMLIKSSKIYLSQLFDLKNVLLEYVFSCNIEIYADVY